MKEDIIKKISEFLKEKGVENPKVNFTPSIYLDKGDYSTNIAMVHAKELSMKPFDLAEEIKNKINNGDVKVEVAQPGFINFFFDKKYFGDNVSKIIEEGGDFGKNKSQKGQKTIIEYTDPNPFKEFHIGHLMPNVTGESIARILDANGAEVNELTIREMSGYMWQRLFGQSKIITKHCWRHTHLVISHMMKMKKQSKKLSILIRKFMTKVMRK
jgi:arginyl-tRNA synthetase